MMRRRNWLAWAGLLVIGLALTGTAQARSAAPLRASTPPPPTANPSATASPAATPTAQPGVSNDYCLSCHGKPDQVVKLASGETLYLTIDAVAYNQSVHGSGSYACVQCHTTIRAYPHPKLEAQTTRDVTLAFYTTCKTCHVDKYRLTLDSVHQQALDKGNQNAAVCTDCHNPHYLGRLTNPATHALLPEARVNIPQICGRCHSVIFDQYKQSVHGSALIGQGNPDVPTCIDCHGVHNISNPTTNAFRLSSPEMCAKCHTDPQRMAKYGISTQVLNTYLADFHGTTVTLFEKTSPDQVTNKPVCFDCHGVHNISRPDDPKTGLEVKQNVLATCRKCHPDATANFPSAWLSHFVPNPQTSPLVFYVDQFYKYFIPVVLGGMAVFVASDIYRRLINRRREPRKPA
jgi:nitrate/TMAO reductase-like tetraheme cytochrome c subunit